MVLPQGGAESAERLRQMPPPNMNHQEWSDHIDYYCRGDVVRRSQANTNVRAQQIHQSSHGRTTYAQYRYQNVANLFVVGARHQNYDANLKKIGNRPLPIDFDIRDQRTFRPVGDNRKDFITLVGVTVGDEIPKNYKSWEAVPQTDKDSIFDELQVYFDLERHWQGPYEERIRTDIMSLAGDRYKDRKYRFKQTWIGDECEDPKQLLSRPPPEMEDDEWKKHVDFFTQENYVARSNSNKANRAKQLYQSRHGSRSYADYRDDHQNKDTGKYPSLIDTYGTMHTKDGSYVHQDARTNYDEMVRLREEQKKTSTPLNEEQILGRVIGKRRGFNKGHGKALKGASSSSQSSGSSQSRRFTQEDLDNVVKTKTDDLAKELTKASKTMKSMWRFLAKKSTKKTRD